MEYKPKYGWLCTLTVLCVLLIGVMAWTLIDKQAQQNQSRRAYEDVSRQALITGEISFSSETPAPADYPLPNEEENVNPCDAMPDESDPAATETKSAGFAAAPRSPLPTDDATVKTPSARETLREDQLGQSDAATRTTAAPAGWISVTATSVTATLPAEAAEAVSCAPSDAPATSGKTVCAGEGWTLLTQTPALQTADESTVGSVSGGERIAQPAAKEPRSAKETTVTETVSLPVSQKPETSDAAGGTSSVSPVTAAPDPTPTPLTTLAPTASPTRETDAPASEAVTPERVVVTDRARYSVDFPYLRDINPDVKAWILQEGTPINYPVVQGSDNEYYLNHLFNRSVNRDGAIFLDCENADTFSDMNLTLFGHRTKTDALFSTLAEYREQAYYEAHPQFTLLTPYGDYQIDLFAAVVFPADDGTSWQLQPFTHKTEFDACIRQLESASLFTPHADAAPEWGDRLVTLVTCTGNRKGERYVVYGRMRQLMYTSSENVSVTKVAMDEKPTLTAWEKVPGRGKMLVYAQNDPLWANMRYENRTSNTRRMFGTGGCGPTSVAMAVANLVPRARLADIFSYAKSPVGFAFSETSVNQFSENKMQYQVQSSDEYLRYLPVVMANFATGNNLWGEVSRGSAPGTSLRFVKRIASLYQLYLKTTGDENEALEAVRGGALAVASLGNCNPFTGGGHYIVLASVDDRYAYFLDPYRQENYDRFDRKHILTNIAPGVVRVKLEDVNKLHIGTSYLLSSADKTASRGLHTVTR